MVQLSNQLPDYPIIQLPDSDPELVGIRFGSSLPIRRDPLADAPSLKQQRSQARLNNIPVRTRLALIRSSERCTKGQLVIELRTTYAVRQIGVTTTCRSHQRSDE
jgi:hypothetical protein